MNPDGGMCQMFRQMRERYMAEQNANRQQHGCRDPAGQTEVKDEVAEKKAEMQKKQEEVRAAKAKVKALKKEVKACRKEMKKVEKKAKERKSLDAEVVGHLDTEEQSQQKPNSLVLKTWKVKNTGTLAWSDDTVAAFHSGNKSLVVSGYEVVHVGALEPNDVAYIRVMFNAPLVEGPYSVTYRLSGPMGKFGGRLNTEIEVIEESVNKPESIPEPAVTFTSEPGSNIPSEIDLSKEVEEAKVEVCEVEEEVKSAPVVSAPIVSAPVPVSVPKFVFQKQKQALKAMGFEIDDESLESVLVACKGDIAQAITLLM